METMGIEEGQGGGRGRQSYGPFVETIWVRRRTRRETEEVQEKKEKEVERQ